jgi:G3E family GTPase
MTRCPVTILGGYLGTGKTTLVNHLLRHADGRRIAVLVNDFGDVAIDADLIEGSDAGLLSLAGGCICCSYGDDLMQALIDLGRRAPRPDHVLIETSGVALPGAVARALTLLFDYVLDAIVVMADAETTALRLADRYMGDTLARQFADADLIVLNKCDLVSAAAVDALEDALKREHARASVARTVNAVLAPDVVLGIDLARTERKTFAVGHGGAAHHAVAFTFERPVDVAALSAELADASLVRAKGIVQDTSGTWQIIQRAGTRVSVEPAVREVTGLGRLVCIAVGAPPNPATLAALRRLGEAP